MRKGHNSLAILISKKTKFEIMEGSLFLFVSKNRKTIKGIFFDGTGLVLVHKKIESGRFMDFNASNSVLEISSNEFKIVFHGGHIPLSRSGSRIKMNNSKKEQKLSRFAPSDLKNSHS